MPRNPASGRRKTRRPGSDIRVVPDTTFVGPAFTQVIATTNLAKARSVAAANLKRLRKGSANAVIKRRRSFFSERPIFTIFIRGKLK